MPLGRNADQLLGDLADAFFQLGLLGLPGAAAQAVKQPFVMAIARQQFDVLDRQNSRSPPAYSR